MEVTPRSSGVLVAVPCLPERLQPEEVLDIQRGLLDAAVRNYIGDEFTLWYYTPMGLPFSQQLAAAAVVYDCMDELSAFAGAPVALKTNEAQLFRVADVVFTGGQSLYEAKRARHPRVHRFQSSVDVHHFGRARGDLADPIDQAAIPRPRLGFFGVIDERMDLNLVAALAQMRPTWQIVIVGPVVKIEPADLPTAPNIHYLGSKQYDELPGYLANWDVALLPFAQNESTRFISPTKTPEYLAAGKPVVSTPITDVVRDYGSRGLVRIASTPAEFVSALEACLADQGQRSGWLEAVDRQLETMSWDRTWSAMKELMA